MVKFGALAFIVFVPQQYAINLQLLGGILILQTLPAVVTGLYTRWFDAKALLLGWGVGVAWGIWMAAALAFKSSIYPLHLFGFVIAGYAGLYALALNFAVALAATAVLRTLGKASNGDRTVTADYAG